MDRLARMVATGLYSGYSPLVPGTVGTVPAWLMAYFLIGDRPLLLTAIAVLTIFVSVWAAGRAETSFGHDARKIVIDEWAGMFLALILVPHSLTNYLIAFVAFRALDVLKLFPAAQAENLPGGWGVTMDDVVAGVQACLLTHATVALLARYASG